MNEGILTFSETTVNCLIHSILDNSVEAGDSIINQQR
jgi:hypothetical protein